MPFINTGSYNNSALTIPGFYTQLVPPAPLINGFPTNILLMVGIATWGPVNAQTPVGNVSQAVSLFGQMQNAKYDLVTGITSACSQGANNIIAIRVTDGTDVAAKSAILDTNSTSTVGINLTALYTGIVGNNIQATISNGASYTSASPTYRLTLALPGGVPEIYDNIGGTGNALWANMANAVNNGISGIRPPSQLCTATVGSGIGQITVTAGGSSYTSVPTVVFTGGGGTGLTATAVLTSEAVTSITITNSGSGYTTAPTISFTGGGGSLAAATAVVGSVEPPAAGNSTFANGTNGNTTITGSVLIGQDSLPRKGMYAGRNSGASVGVLVDCDESSTFAAQVDYALTEGTYMIGCFPLGQAYATSITALQTAGIDSFAFKAMLGDWVYFQDTVNNLYRYISPSSYVAGELSAMAPQFSTLNQPMYNIAGTESTQNNYIYSSADLQAISLGRVDVITNPCPGGYYFGCRMGRNCSSNSVINEDNYPRMSFFLQQSFNSALGIFVGQLNNASTRANVRAALNAFLAALLGNQQIGAFSVYVGEPTDQNTNNPQSQIALGYLQANVQVQYLSIIEYFILNMQGGQSVQVQSINVQPVTQ